MARLAPERNYAKSLLVPHRDSLLPIKTDDISYIYTAGKNTVVCLNDEQQYFYSKSLDNLINMLSPDDFFRANKQFIVSRNSVKKITAWFDRRLLLTLNTKTPETLFVSKNKAAEFKQWMIGKD